jgi:hypothetical protein
VNVKTIHFTSTVSFFIHLGVGRINERELDAHSTVECPFLNALGCCTAACVVPGNRARKI